MTDPASLTDRQRDLLTATVAVWQASQQPLVWDLNDAAEPVEGWPEQVARMRKEEARELTHRGWLQSNRQVRHWEKTPTQAAVEHFDSTGQARSIHDMLRDPDARLGVILEALVDSYAADPSEPAHLAVMDAADVMQAAGWQLAPDAARVHDFRLLEQAGLAIMTPRGEDWAIVPTPLGRRVVDAPYETAEEIIASLPADQQSKARQALKHAGDMGKTVVGGLIVKLLTAGGDAGGP